MQMFKRDLFGPDGGKCAVRKYRTAEEIDAASAEDCEYHRNEQRHRQLITALARSTKLPDAFNYLPLAARFAPLGE